VLLGFADVRIYVRRAKYSHAEAVRL
jgi:hypothetical protein